MRGNNSHMRGLLTAALLCTTSLLPAADPIFKPLYESTQRAIAQSKIVLEDKPGVFFENLAIADDGFVYITSFMDGRLLQIKASGESKTFAQLPGAVSGIVATEDGFLTIGWDQKQRRVMWHVSQRGEVTEALAMPEVGLPNGFTMLDAKKSPHVLLLSDSVKGLIWRADLQQKSISVWSADAALGGFDASLKPEIPAVNGIKVHKGFVYFANMQQRSFGRIPIKPDGSAGAAEVVLREIFIDDFAIDANDNIYAATHPYNSVIRIDRHNKVTVIASYDQGLQGATSVAFSKGKNGANTLYVTTGGGSYVPPPYGFTGGKLLRIEIPR
jgi:sugar lactone lactonase YvrE